MKNLFLSFSLLSFLFLLPTSSSANDINPVEANTPNLNDCNCPYADVELSSYFNVRVERCNNSVRATGYIFGYRAGAMGFQDNGKGMFVLEKHNGLYGFKIYVEKANGKLWYKTGHRRGVDDHKFNWSKRQRL